MNITPARHKKPSWIPDNRHVATPRTRKIVVFFMWASAANYFFHLLGFSIISAETLKKIPFIPIKTELFRMEYSEYYSKYADAYAGFMTFIMLQFVISTLLIAYVVFRRIFVKLQLVKNQELESISLFFVMFLFYIMGSYLWVFEWNSVFWNANPKIGGNYYWFSTLLISFPWLAVLPVLVIFTLEPKVLNYSIFERTQKQEK